jgi:hypothetical protein
MNCHECDGLLQRLLDGEVVASPELDRHLADCGNCRGLFAAAQRMLSGLRHMPAPLPPPHLARQVTQRVVRERLSRTRIRWSAAAAMMAACVLVAIWFYQNRNQDFALAPVADADQAKSTQAKDPTLTQTARDRGKALDHFASQMLDKVRKDVDIMRDATAALEAPRLDQPRPTTEPRMARTRPGMTTGLQTVTAITRRGVSFMLRDASPLPNGKDNAE